MRLVAGFAFAVLVAATVSASAQTQAPKQENSVRGDCPPDVDNNPPVFGDNRSGYLGQDLAQSKGVICPPAGVDPDIRIAPPAGGRTPEINPKDLPGGENQQPK